MPDRPPDLRGHYRSGRLIPFIGAGVSASVSWTDGEETKRPPTWRELVDHAARDLGFTDPDLLRVRGTDLQILEYFSIERDGRDPLVDWLVKSVDVPEQALRESVIHKALAACRNCRLIYTTNYDNLIERAFAIHDRPAVMLARESDFPASFEKGLADSSTSQIVKFHGDLSSRKTMVLTESDYEKRLKLQTEMDLRLRSDLLGRAVLFIGYSFRDPNVSYIFELIREAFAGLPRSAYGRRAFITVSDPSRFERKLFERRGIDVIAIDSSAQSEEIGALLTSLNE